MPHTNTIEALTLELDRVNRELSKAEESTKELIDTLKSTRGAISTINFSKYHKTIIDDAPVYWQTEEWCEWMRGEVTDEINKAIQKAESR